MDQKNPNQIVQESRQNKPQVNVKLNPNQNTNKQRYRPRRRKVFRKRLGPQNRNQSRNQNNTNSRRSNRNNSQKRQRPLSGGSNRQTRRARLFVRNLTKSVTNTDLRGLFEKIGPLRRCGINWNDLGESKGTADVQYQYEEDTYKAFQRLDNKNLKGVPIRIELKGGRPRNMNQNNNSFSNGPRRFRRRVQFRRRNQSANNRNNRNNRNNSNNNNRQRRNRNNSNRRGQRRYKTYNQY